MQGANNRLPHCLNEIALRRFFETETSSSSLNRDAKSWPRREPWSSLLMLSGILPIRVHRKLVCRAVYTTLEGRNMVNKLNLTGFLDRHAFFYPFSANWVLSIRLRKCYISKFLPRVDAHNRSQTWRKVSRKRCSRLQQIIVVLCICHVRVLPCQIWCRIICAHFPLACADWTNMRHRGRAVRGAEMDKTLISAQSLQRICIMCIFRVTETFIQQMRTALLL